MAYFPGFSEVGTKSLTAEKPWLFCKETYQEYEICKVVALD